MSKSFLITSHTEGKHSFEQKILLLNLVKSLKKFFPDCFIIIASASEVDYESQKLADYILIDKITENKPHGIGELTLVKSSLEVLEKFQKTECYKITYDFIINESNFQVFDKWKSHGADFVSCLWKSMSVGIGSWCWYGKLDILKQIFNFQDLILFMEWSLMTSLHEQNLYYRCYFYETPDEMLDNTWLENGNLVTYEGLVLKHKYGKIVLTLELDETTEFILPNIIQTLCYQTKLPDHIVIVDCRKNKQDLRTNQTFQEMFNLMNEKNITWRVIFYPGFDHFNKFLFELGYEWNYLIKNIKLSDLNLIKNLYEKIIMDRSIGLIVDKNNNIFYKNRVIDPNLNFENKEFILNKIKEAGYNINYTEIDNRL